MARGEDGLDPQVAHRLFQEHIASRDGVDLGLDDIRVTRIQHQRMRHAVADATGARARQKVAPGGIADGQLVGRLARQQRLGDAARSHQRDVAAADLPAVVHRPGCGHAHRQRARRGDHHVATLSGLHAVDRQVVQRLADVDAALGVDGLQPTLAGVDVVRAFMAIGREAAAEGGLRVGHPGGQRLQRGAADASLRAQLNAPPADEGAVEHAAADLAFRAEGLDRAVGADRGHPRGVVHLAQHLDLAGAGGGDVDPAFVEANELHADRPVGLDRVVVVDALTDLADQVDRDRLLAVPAGAGVLVRDLGAGV